MSSRAGSESTSAPGGRPVPDEPSEAIASSSVDPQRTVISKVKPEVAPDLRGPVSPLELGPLLSGQRLGFFQLEEFVGGGGMGAVFRATDTKLDRTVAVKVISRDQTDPETLRRFTNEAQSAARLDHPNIARVYYVGEDQGWNYIVFEFIEGVNVRDLIDQQGPLGVQEFLHYVLQIAEALEHASEREVIHRDIKPSNILVMADGRAKLVDMGLARLHQVESSTNDLTASGVTLGTFDYISPEQARDPRSADVRSDLYSLGCTMFFMLTGKPPFPDGTVLQKLLSHSSDPPPDPRAWRADLDERLVAIIGRLLAKQPKQRYARPRDLIVDLLSYAEARGMSVPKFSTVWLEQDLQRKRSWERTLPWVMPIGILLTVVIALPFTGNDSTAETEWEPPRFASQGRVAVEDDEAEAGPASPAAGSPGEDESGADEEAVETSDDGAPAAETGDGTGTEDVVQPPEASDPEDTSEAEGPRVPAAVPAPLVAEPVPVIVTDSLTEREHESDKIAVATIEEALRYVWAGEALPNIELDFDGERQLRPMEWPVGSLEEEQLDIRSAAGRQPVLVFRPDDRDIALTSTPTMVRIIGGATTLTGVHFRLELDAALGPRAGWSLFKLDDTQNVKFHQCSLTVRNVRPDGTAGLHGPVAFFEYPRPDVAESSSGSLMPTHRPEIWLFNSVARGQATLVRAEQAVPCFLYWDHGLFLSSERLVDVGGVAVRPRWDDGRIELILKRVLLVSGQGIFRSTIDTRAPYELELTTDCERCLIATLEQQPPVPLYELAGSSGEFSPRPLPEIAGQDNYYKNTQLVVRVDPTGNPLEWEEYAFDDLSVPGEYPWYQETRSSSAEGVFMRPLPAVSFDEQTPGDYFDGGPDEERLTRILQLDPTALPVVGR